MNGGHLLIVTFLGFLALTDGGHLFGKGFVKGALKTLFKSEKKEQNCEIKWEDVWKPHCTTTYEKVTTFKLVPYPPRVAPIHFGVRRS